MVLIKLCEIKIEINKKNPKNMLDKKTLKNKPS